MLRTDSRGSYIVKASPQRAEWTSPVAALFAAGLDAVIRLAGWVVAGRTVVAHPE
jgi:hypothetical protein